MKKLSLVLAVAAATLAAPAAHAAFVNGGFSIGGAFQNQAALSNLPTSMVGLLTSFDVNPGMIGSGGTGDLASITFPTIGTATDFSRLSAPQTVFGIIGYTFQVLSWGPVVSGAMNCISLQCTDAISFTGFGVVTGNAATPTAFTMSWSAQGTCNESTFNLGQCAPGSGSASYSASISATGVAVVPEPASLALVGLALAGAGLVSRRRKA